MRIPIANLLMRPDRNKIPFEVEEELRFHIEMLELKYAQHGLSVRDSKAAALKRFGNLERVKKQCVHISRRNTLLQRVLKLSSIFVALTGLTIQVLSSDYKVARIGNMLVMIAVATRLLLYVRGFLPRTKEPPLSLLKTFDTVSNERRNAG